MVDWSDKPNFWRLKWVPLRDSNFQLENSVIVSWKLLSLRGTHLIEPPKNEVCHSNLPPDRLLPSNTVPLVVEMSVKQNSYFRDEDSVSPSYIPSCLRAVLVVRML